MREAKVTHRGPDAKEKEGRRERRRDRKGGKSLSHTMPKFKGEEEEGEENEGERGREARSYRGPAGII